MVLFPSLLLRVTKVLTLLIISYFHVVDLSFRLNKMMVNTSCEESLV